MMGVQAAAQATNASGQSHSGTRNRIYADFVKRGIDVGVSLAVCAVSVVPLAVACAAICAESPGAPVFQHERVGKNGKLFGMWKLRTMYSDAEERMEHYLTPSQLEQWRREHKVDNDPRVTKVGRILRRTSLDELPQFINVLTGSMSVIGPRPVTPSELTWYGEHVDEILSVRPGITGYWQAFARNQATWESGERQSMELLYVRNVSLSMDAAVFLRTFGAVAGLTGR